MSGTSSPPVRLLEYLGHNRLSAFGVSGTTREALELGLDAIESQSPFGFWGEWNKFVVGGFGGLGESLSAFGVIGTPARILHQREGKGHNRLSAFGVSGTIRM